MNKKNIKIDFSDFWGGFNKINNYFYNLLKQQFNVIISPNPDYLFFSVFGTNHKNYNCKKIFYTGENVLAPLGYCQYSFSFDYLDDPRNYRLPHYLLYDGYYELLDKKVNDSLVNRKFCNFVASNPNSLKRNDFVNALNKYKRIDCAGKWMNNIGGPVSDKLEFQKQYKFSIAFENGAYRPEFPGYTTEKIMQPMSANSIPIYWGNPKINLEFNTKSFINFYDYPDSFLFKDLIDKIIELDTDDDKYMEVLREPWFPGNQIPENNKIENIKSFLYKIFE